MFSKEWIILWQLRNLGDRHKELSARADEYWRCCWKTDIVHTNVWRGRDEMNFASSVIFCPKTTRELLNFVTSLSEVWRWVSLQSQPGPNGIHEGKVTLRLGTKIAWVLLGRITLKRTAVGPPLRWQSTTWGTKFCASKWINFILQSWLWNKYL